MIKPIDIVLRHTLSKWAWIFVIGMLLGCVIDIPAITLFITIFFGLCCGVCVYLDTQMDCIYFTRLRPDAVTPSRDSENAGYDIYASFEEEYIEIAPGETKMVPTGIASHFNERYVMILKERGSTGTKGMGQRCGVIDSSYLGEWFVPITNHNKSKYLFISKISEEELSAKITSKTKQNKIVYPYTKGICQAILLPVPEVYVKEISNEKFAKFDTERGDGCLGSSGK